MGLSGDKVIVPPPATAEAAESRASQGCETTNWHVSKRELQARQPGRCGSCRTGPPSRDNPTEGHRHDKFRTDGTDWDRLFADGETFMVGGIEFEVLLAPGHTPASIACVAGDAAFVHYTLMMPDSGTSRADFPGGDAAILHASIERILGLPDDTRVLVGHDHAPDGREPLCETTVREQCEIEQPEVWKLC